MTGVLEESQLFLTTEPSPHATAFTVEFSQWHTFLFMKTVFFSSMMKSWRKALHIPLDPVSTVPKSFCFNSAPSIRSQVEAETKDCWSVEGEKGGSERVWRLLRDAGRASCQDQLLLGGLLAWLGQSQRPPLAGCTVHGAHRPGPPVPRPGPSGSALGQPTLAQTSCGIRPRAVPHLPLLCQRSEGPGSQEASVGRIWQRFSEGLEMLDRRLLAWV